MAIRPVMLVILDGFGWREESADNAVRLAKTPTFSGLWESCPHSFLHTSGRDVGLPEGQMGNSEVGHLNIGAGRVVKQELVRIGDAVSDGSIAEAPAFVSLVDALKKTGGTCHLIGLLSPGGVHSHQDHGAALAGHLHRAGVKSVVHAITDGRDTPPQSAAEYLKRFQAALPDGVPVATVIGRYFAMDRDKRWDRVALAYGAMVEAEGARAATPGAAVEAAYAAGKFDEFVPASVIDDYAGMKDGDAVLCFNFRADRVREILAALLDPAFDGFPRKRVLKFAAAVGMTRYSDALAPFLGVLFAAGAPAQHPGRGRRRRRQDPASHGGDREICPCHLLSERWPGNALHRRGPDPGSIPEGRHLRSAAGDVGARACRQGGRGDQFRKI